MKVKKFASYQGTLVLDEFYQLCMNIDPVTRCSVCYFRQRTDACLGKKDYLHKPFIEGVKLIK